MGTFSEGYFAPIPLKHTVADYRVKADKVESAPENQSHTFDALFAPKNSVLFVFALVSDVSPALNGKIVVVQQEYKIMDSSNKLDLYCPSIGLLTKSLLKLKKRHFSDETSTNKQSSPFDPIAL